MPSQYLKAIIGTNGLYEARIKLASDNGFQKKTQKTPKKEIEKAAKLMNEYFEDKEGTK